jgi:hypothetical protein
MAFKKVIVKNLTGLTLTFLYFLCITPKLITAQKGATIEN